MRAAGLRHFMVIGPHKARTGWLTERFRALDRVGPAFGSWSTWPGR